MHQIIHLNNLCSLHLLNNSIFLCFIAIMNIGVKYEMSDSGTGNDRKFDYLAIKTLSPSNNNIALQKSGTWVSHILSVF